jgi:hypothetical protein
MNTVRHRRNQIDEGTPQMEKEGFTAKTQRHEDRERLIPSRLCAFAVH